MQKDLIQIDLKILMNYVYPLFNVYRHKICQRKLTNGHIAYVVHKCLNTHTHIEIHTDIHRYTQIYIDIYTQV